MRTKPSWARTWRVVVVLALAAVVVSSAGARVCPPRHLFWGAWIGDHFAGGQPPWNMAAVGEFERLAGKGMSLVEFSTPSYDCRVSPCKAFPFQATLFNRIRAHGSIPFFSWASDSIPVSRSQPDFQLQDVTAGNYDPYFRAWATAAKAWAHPFFLRFNWEMNGGWFPWGESANGNRPGDFVAAWRHVHDIFTAVGATNVTWVWCPSVDVANTYTPMAQLYPGDAYVDWTCLDGYNWDRPWLTFDQVFRSSYDTVVSLAPTKPMIIGEMSSTEAGGSKSAWITDALQNIATGYPQIKGAIWMEAYDSDQDWPIETSVDARAAFAAGIASSKFIGNAFARLSGRAIRPLP